MRSVGKYYCPACVCQREFIVWEEHGATPATEAECHECGFVWGYKTDELNRGADGSATSVPWITPEVQHRQQAKMLAEWRESLVSSGVRLENFNGVAAPRRRDDR